MAAAAAYLKAGLSVVPAFRDGDRKGVALPSWAEYQTRLPTEHEVRHWFADATRSVGIVCGAVSGGLLCLDFDCKGEAFERFAGALPSDLRAKIVVERTPSGGYHVLVRGVAEGNRKLARRRVECPDGSEVLLHGKKHVPRRDRHGKWCVTLTLIETRGEGGMVITAPSPGYEIVQGDIANPPVLNRDERESLMGAARALDEVEDDESKLVAVPKGHGGDRPGDDFHQRGDIRPTLLKHGWKLHRPGDNEHWTRPGKSSGTSATLRANVLRVFSSNAPPFEPDKSYGAFGVYALLEHGGDFAAAATDLRRQGYGERRDAGGQGAGAVDGPTPEVGPVVACMADIPPERVKWLWESKIPLGRMTLLVGKPGEGKSILTLDLAATVTSGRDHPDGTPCERGGVLLVCAEDDAADTIRPRLDGAGADVTKVHILRAVRRISRDGRLAECAFTLDDLGSLEAAMRSVPDLKLVIIDPAGSYMGGDIDSHRDTEIRSVLAPVAMLAERYGVAMLLVAHRRKSVGIGGADEQTLGSVGFVGLARAVWHVVRDRDDKSRRLLLPGKCNLGPEPAGLAYRIEGDPPRCVWEPDPITESADDVLAGDHHTPGPAPYGRRAAEDFLAAELAGGPRLSVDLEVAAEQAGISLASLRRAKHAAGILARRREGDAHGRWEWYLPEATCSGSAQQPEQPEQPEQLARFPIEKGPFSSCSPEADNLSNLIEYVPPKLFRDGSVAGEVVRAETVGRGSR